MRNVSREVWRDPPTKQPESSGPGGWGGGGAVMETAVQTSVLSEISQQDAKERRRRRRAPLQHMWQLPACWNLLRHDGCSGGEPLQPPQKKSFPRLVMSPDFPQVWLVTTLSFVSFRALGERQKLFSVCSCSEILIRSSRTSTIHVCHRQNHFFNI